MFYFTLRAMCLHVQLLTVMLAIYSQIYMQKDSKAHQHSHVTQIILGYIAINYKALIGFCHLHMFSDICYVGTNICISAYACIIKL